MSWIDILKHIQQWQTDKENKGRQMDKEKQTDRNKGTCWLTVQTVRQRWNVENRVHEDTQAGIEEANRERWRPNTDICRQTKDK